MILLDQKNLGEAIASMPTFHYHYEYHGKWCQQHHAVIEAALKAAYMSEAPAAMPEDISGITALSIALEMDGKWNKRLGEKDTEKVKRIYRVFRAVIMNGLDRIR